MPRAKATFRESAGSPAAEAGRRGVENEAGGFLAIKVQDLTDGLEGALPERGLLPRPALSDPQAWVVVWKSLSAAVVALGGVGMLARLPDRSRVDWLMPNLDTAAKALVAGPPEHEWKDWS